MTANPQPPVTIGVINHNGADTLPATLQSLNTLNYPAYEVMVVDDGSTDGSREWVEEHHPEFQCISLGKNRGAAAARNEIIRRAETDYVLILDNDIVIEEDTLNCLMYVMRLVPKAAVCHPELRDPGDPEVYHYNGGWNHFLCALVPRRKPEPGERRPVYEVFPGCGGGAMLLDRQAALQVGAFDEDFFFNMEDGDFTARLTLAGYLVLNVPGAVAYHRSRPRGTSKVFYQVRNRWFYILKLYSLRTMVLAAPALLAYELSQFALLLVKGAGKEYLRGTLAALISLPDLLRKRRAFQKLKVRRDRDWLRSGEMYLPSVWKRERWLLPFKILSEVSYSIYWALIRPFC